MIPTLLGLALVRADRITSPVEIPFRVVENAIIVDPVVNGHKVSAVFDTGFSGGFALTSSIDFGQPTGKVNIRDFVGTSAVNSFDVKSLKMGSMTFSPGDMKIISQEGFEGSWGYGTHIDGLMGIEPLAPYVFEVNVEKSKFVLKPDSEDISQRKPDNKRTFLVRILPMGTRHLPIATKTADGQTLVMALDTGNSGFATTHPDSLAKVGLWTEGKQAKWTFPSYIASGAVDTFSVGMKDTKIFGIPVAASVWSVLDRPSSGADSDGTVGFQFLKNFNFTIDMRRRLVWMENFTGQFGNDEVGSPGMSAFGNRNGKGMHIVRVLADSPAEKAGIKAGDKLVAIGDEVIGNVGQRKVERLLQGPAGSKVKVQVSRGGVLKTFELERVLLVNPVGK